ncbi:MAG: hypothetical protein R2912_03870 [Eubacteriales bacterium]
MKKTNEVKNKASLRLNPLSMHVNPDLFERASDEEKQDLVTVWQGTSLWERRNAPLQEEQICNGRVGADHSVVSVCVRRTAVFAV